MYNITFVKTYMQNYAKKYKDIAILFIFFAYYPSVVRKYTLTNHSIYQVNQKSHLRLSSSMSRVFMLFHLLSKDDKRVKHIK